MTPGADSDITLGTLVRRFRRGVGFTFALVVVEAAAFLLFPLVIGRAIDDLLADRLGGVVLLGGLGVATLVIGATRRWIDTRTYASIYETTATELATAERRRGTDVSIVTARTNLLTEFVEFLEESMPMIVNSVIGIVGTLVILSQIHLGVFAASLGLAALVGVVYAATGRRNLALTGGYNDELERQVGALASGATSDARRHFGELMRWNRRLSDLETINFSIIYLGVIALLVYGPIALVDGIDAEYGVVFAAIVYVLQYVEAVLEMPLFLQQLIRLREISTRLQATDLRPPAPAGTG